MGKLTDKVAIVTGAGRGIGRGIAVALGAAGAKVIVSSRTPKTIEEVVEGIRSAGGVAEGVTCDVSEKEQIESCIEKTVKLFGTIDVLVNNAQSFGTEKEPSTVSSPKSFEELPDEEWEWTMRTGLWSTIWAMKAAFPHMKEKGGKIINMASPAGIYAQQGASAYVATKEGIRGLSKVAARDWGKYNITVNCILPVIMTDTLKSAYEEYTSSQGDQADMAVPANILQRFGDSERDVGPLAVYLASSDSDYMTGQDLSIDGGYYLRS